LIHEMRRSIGVVKITISEPRAIMDQLSIKSILLICYNWRVDVF